VIVRATPQPRQQPRPMTYRERTYVLEALRAGYTTRRMRRFIKGAADRLYQIIHALELPPMSKGPKVGALADVLEADMPRPLLRRCDDCGQLYGRDTCPCEAP
jgi:hypothetical protein